MYLLSNYTTSRIIKYKKREWEFDLEHDDYISYLALAMNTSETEIKNTYSSIEKILNMRTLLPEFLELLDSR